MTDFLFHKMQPELDISDADAEQLWREVEQTHKEAIDAALFMMQKGAPQWGGEWLRQHADERVRLLGQVFPRLAREILEKRQAPSCQVIGNVYEAGAHHEDNGRHLWVRSNVQHDSPQSVENHFGEGSVRFEAGSSMNGAVTR